MFKNYVLLICLASPVASLADTTKRQVTLTTYYPAPIGSYDRVQVGKGITSTGSGDIAIQRQLKIGDGGLPGPAPSTFGQAIVNIDLGLFKDPDGGNDPVEYNYFNDYLYFNTGSDPGWDYSAYTGLDANGLPLDIAVGGHTRLSGQGKAAIAGYIDVLPWIDSHGDTNMGGEISLMGTGATPVNWSADTYDNKWRLRSNVGGPFDDFSSPSVPFDRLILTENGNMFTGKMFADSGQVAKKIDITQGGSLFAGSGALVRSRQDSADNLWDIDTYGVPANPGVYSMEDNVIMNFAINDSTFAWYSGGMDGITGDPESSGLEMTFYSSNGLNIKDGLYVKGVHETAGETLDDTLGLRVNKQTWLENKVGIGGEPDDNYILKVFGSGVPGNGWGTASEGDVLLGDDLIVEDNVAIGFGAVPPERDTNTGLYALKDVEIGDLESAPPYPRKGTGEGGITAGDFIMTTAGDFFSKSGALVKYDINPVADSFNPADVELGPGIYSNQEPMYFVTREQDFKWYSEGYKVGNVVGNIGNSPLMTLVPPESVSTQKGLTISSGFHIKKTAGGPLLGSIQTETDLSLKTLKLSITGEPVLTLEYNKGVSVDASTHLVKLGFVNSSLSFNENKDVLPGFKKGDGLAVFGDLLIPLDGLPDNSITGKDIVGDAAAGIEGTIQAEDMINDPSIIKYYNENGGVVHADAIVASVPGLNVDYLDGYDSQDIFEELVNYVQTCAKPISYYKHNDTAIQAGIKNCLNKITGKNKSDITVTDYYGTKIITNDNINWKCSYYTDLYPRGGYGIFTICHKTGMVEEIVPPAGGGNVTNESIYGVYDKNGNYKPNETDIAMETIGSENIRNGTILQEDLANQSVGSDEIVNNSITSADIRNLTITDDDLGDNSIGSSQIVTNGVNRNDFANATIRGDYWDANRNGIADAGDDLTIGNGGGDIAQETITGWNIKDNAIDEDNLADNSVGEAQIVPGSVTRADIAPETIQGVDIAPETITGWNIKDNSILLEDLAPNSVGAEELAAGSVTTNHILDNSLEVADFQDLSAFIGAAWNDPGSLTITSFNIQDGTVTLADLGNNSVNSNKIVDLSIRLEDLAPNSVDSTKIVYQTITGSDIAGETITGWNIRGGSLLGAQNGDGTGDIAGNTITGWNIQNTSLNQSHLGANSVGSDEIINNSINSSHIAAGTILAQDINLTDLARNYELYRGFSIASAMITDGEVYSADIADTSIKGAELLDGTGDIAGNTITGSNIADGTIGNVKLKTGSVDSSKIVDGAVKESHLATNSVNSDKIKDKTIEKIDFSAALMNSIVWNVDNDADTYIDITADKADKASYIEIDDGGVIKKCKVTADLLTYYTGLAATSVTRLGTDSAGENYNDNYYTYAVDGANNVNNMLVMDAMNCLP